MQDEEKGDPNSRCYLRVFSFGVPLGFCTVSLSAAGPRISKCAMDLRLCCDWNGAPLRFRD